MTMFQKKYENVCRLLVDTESLTCRLQLLVDTESVTCR